MGPNLAIATGTAAATWAALTAAAWTVVSLPAAVLAATFAVGCATVFIGWLNRP
jgi:hypothetical protein